MADDIAQAPVTQKLSLRWGRVLIGALLVEVVLFAIAAGAYFLPNGQNLLLYVVPPACLVVSCYFAYWAARGAANRFILHGTLVGVVAALIYIALTWRQTLPMAYTVSHFLKVIGGALGGFIAQRLASRSS